MRKLVRSCRSGLVLDIQRPPTEFLPQSIPPLTPSSVQNQPPQKSIGSEHSAGYCSLPTLAHALTPTTSNSSFTAARQTIPHQTNSSITTSSNVRHHSLVMSSEQIPVNQDNGKPVCSSLSNGILWSNKLSFTTAPTYSVKSLNVLSPKQTSV